jgi:outer membrane protein TolC
MRFGWAVTAVAVGLLCWAGSAGWAKGAEKTVSQWEVGQDKVTPELLKVAPPATAPDELTLHEAQKLAMQSNVSFRSAILSMLNARSAWETARQRWNFSVSASYSKSHNGGTSSATSVGGGFSLDLLTGATINVSAELNRLNSEEAEQSATLSIDQPLINGAGWYSNTYQSLRAARNNYRSALLSFFDSRQSLAYEVVSSYFGVIRVQQSVKTQERYVQQVERQAKDAQLRLDNGLTTDIDVTRAQLSLSQAQTDLVNAQQDERDAMDRFLLMLGLQIGGNPKLVTQLPGQAALTDVDEATRIALEKRPAIYLTSLDLENAEIALRLARNSTLPSLAAAGALHHYTDGDTSRSWDIGLQLSVPIGSRALSEAVKHAEWALLLARQQQEYQRQEITLEIRSQVRQAESARTNVEYAIKGMEMATRQMKSAQRMVDEGLSTNRELLEAQDALAQSENNVENLKIQYYLAIINLHRAMGMDIAGELLTPVAPANIETTKPIS